ncbi:GNAT family N-acetyltransferase, partial [bacterium]|nr:GNAT family N-acetyltransferase [bacterium]
MDSYRVEVADKNDKSAVLELIRSIYPESVIDEKYWEWRYYCNSVGEVNLYIVRDKLHDIVALQAVTSFSGISEEKSVVLHLLTAAVTHENHRRKGLFRKLITFIQNDLVVEKSAFAFTIPNELSTKAFSNFNGWSAIQEMKWWIKPILSNIVSKSRESNSGFVEIETQIRKGFTIKSIPRSDIEAFDFSLINTEKSKTQLLKSGSYLQWRYGEQSPYQYAFEVIERDNRFLGYIVLRKMNIKGVDLCLIADISATSPVVFRLLMLRATSIAFKNKLKGVGFISSTSNPLHKDLFINGFFPVPNWLTGRKFFLWAYTGESAENHIAESGW